VRHGVGRVDAVDRERVLLAVAPQHSRVSLPDGSGRLADDGKVVAPGRADRRLAQVVGVEGGLRVRPRDVDDGGLAQDDDLGADSGEAEGRVDLRVLVDGDVEPGLLDLREAREREGAPVGPARRDVHEDVAPVAFRDGGSRALERRAGQRDADSGKGASRLVPDEPGDGTGEGGEGGTRPRESQDEKQNDDEVRPRPRASDSSHEAPPGRQRRGATPAAATPEGRIHSFS
jgi:hypothetical protein